MVKKTITKSVIERIPIYLNYLNKIDESGLISATILAKKLGLGEVQVRKDLNKISGSGKPKIGYKVIDLKNDIKKLMNQEENTNVIIIGAGKIGMALYNYIGFQKNHFSIVGIFDNNPTKINNNVMSINNLEEFCKTKKVDLAILTVSSENAQIICDEISKIGIKGILNFTDQKLNIPDDIKLRNVDIVAELIALAIEINNN